MKIIKEKIRKFLKLFLMILTTICISITPVFASSTDTTDPDGDGIPGIEGVDYIIVKCQDVDTSDLVTDSIRNRNDYEVMSSSYYSIKNVRFTGVGTKSIATAQVGTPGGTIGFSTTVSYSLTYTLTSGFTLSDLSAALGFTVQKSYTSTLSYSYKIPETNDGKKVKTAKLGVVLDIASYDYDFYRITTKLKTRTTEKPKQIRYIVSFTYY